MNRVASWLLLVSGILLLVMAAAHGFLGWPAVRGELGELRAPGDVIRGIEIGWLYGSAAMATFGVLVLAAWRGSRTGRIPVAAVAAWIAALYLAFGAWAFLRTSGGAHFIVFIVVGAILGVAAFGARGRG